MRDCSHCGVLPAATSSLPRSRQANEEASRSFLDRPATEPLNRQAPQTPLASLKPSRSRSPRQAVRCRQHPEHIANQTNPSGFQQSNRRHTAPEARQSATVPRRRLCRRSSYRPNSILQGRPRLDALIDAESGAYATRSDRTFWDDAPGPHNCGPGSPRIGRRREASTPCTCSTPEGDGARWSAQRKQHGRRQAQRLEMRTRRTRLESPHPNSTAAVTCEQA